MIKKIFWGRAALMVAALATVSFMATSCGDDNTPEPNGSGENVDGGGADDGFSNEETINEVLDPSTTGMAYLKATAVEAYDLFRPVDQKATIEALRYFDDELSEYELPEAIEDIYKKAVRAYARALSGDLGAFTRAATSVTYNYTFNLEAGKGIYKAVRSEERWVRVGDSDKIVLQYTDEAGRACECVIAPSGGSSTVNFDTEDWEDYYDERGWYTGHDVTNHITAYVPRHLEFTFTQAGTKLIASSVDAEYNGTAKTAKVSGTVQVANLSAVFAVNATNSKGTFSSTVKVGSKTLCTAKGEIFGSDLCDIAKLQDELSSDEVNLFLHSGTAETNLLGRVQVKGKVTDFQSLCDAMDTWYSNDYEPYDPETEAKKAAAAARRGVEAKVYYGGSSVEQASLTWKAKRSDYYSSPWYSYEDWVVDPQLQFANGVLQSFDDYFNETRFDDILDIYDDLFDAYEALWDND